MLVNEIIFLMKRPTQKDVADLAGVSRGTVSMVLNGQTSGRVPISEETRNRVVAAAEKIGYAPNPVAQMLAKGQNHIVGVFVYSDVFPYQQTDYFFPYLSGIQHAAIHQNYNVLLFTQNHHQPDAAQVYENSMNTLRLADGCIFMGTHTNRNELARLCEENYPFVYVGRREIDDHQINWVINDYRSGAIEVMQHLIDFNHRTIGFVANTLHLEPQQDKLAGCYHVLKDHPEAELTNFGYNTREKQEELMDSIVTKKLTALICDDNITFYRILEILKTLDIRIPEDLSIVSLTTAEIDRVYGLHPTHLNLDRPAIGEKAVEVLIQLIGGEIEAPQQIMMPAHFVAGDTTGPCPT